MPRLKKRADGRYCLQVYLGKGKDGKRKYKTVYGSTQSEVERERDQVRVAMRKGLDVTADQDTFKVWADRWEKVKAPEVSRGRMTTYKCNLKKVEPLENMPIIKIKTADIQDIIFDLANNPKRPAAKKTLLGIRSTISQVFDLAIENRVLDYNPALAVRIPKGQPQEERRALTKEEQGWIFEMPHRARTAALIMMLSGLRRGELIPLTWNDVDFDEKTISMTKSVEVINNVFVIKDGAKTKEGVRVIPIPQQLVDLLREERKKNLSLYVCTNARGGMHTPSSWKRMWESYIRDLNIEYGIKRRVGEKEVSKHNPNGVAIVIPYFTPHWLRHTYATNLYLAGVDVLDAKEFLGHSDIKTTLDIYTHLDKEHKQKNISKFEDFLNAQMGNDGKGKKRESV